MAGGVSSSKRKPSKKKIGKTSTQRKKNKVKESKRRNRKHGPISSYSDDDSFTSECSSSSKSVSEYRRKKKTSKKRHHRDYSVSSYSNDHPISKDSDSLSTGDNIRKSKKKRRSKTSLKRSRKRARKQYSSPESDEDARQTKRKRLNGDRSVKPKKKSSVKKSKKHLKKHLSRSSSPDSLSCSACPSKSSNSGSIKQIVNKETEIPMDKKLNVRSPSGDISVSVSHSEGTLPLVNSSRRLRSVIVVAYQPGEGEGRWENDPRKEEIMLELDGNPSPISMDSNGGGNKRETDSHSRCISNKRIQVEHEKITEHADTNDFDKVKDKDVSVPVAALGGNDIESILRQKALENLRKFKVGLQKAPHSISHTKMNNKNNAPDKSTEQASPNMQLANQRSAFSEVKKHPEEEPGMEQTVAQSSGAAPFVGRIEENLGNSSSAALAEAVLVSDVNPGKQATDVSNPSVAEKTSYARSCSEKHSLEEQPDETPEFEQKTMSVMRGGEMVQVTYKVKIPKRAPVLGRRQLKR